MDIDKKYNEWLESSRIMQIRYISLLTASLYMMYGIIDSYVAPKESLFLFHLIHIIIIPSFLFVTSILTFFKKYYSFMIKLMIVASILAIFGNLVILRVLEEPTIYFPEIYFAILWVFIFSGLRLAPAIFTASIMGVISIISVFFLMDTITKEQFILHIFWIFCSIAFGLLGSYFIERFSKEIFLNKEAISKLAVTDKLTGLYNRAKFDEVIEYELARAKRYENRFSLMILDIDHFKLVNDTFGHSVGDLFLKEITSLIQKNIRSTDIFVRWGGEEFVLISPQVDEDGAITLANYLLNIVREYEFTQVGKKTISIGVTLYKKDDNASSILKRADNALYEAKNSGRDRVVLN